MEELEIEELPIPSESNFCDTIVERFGNSTHEHHHHLCAVVGAMSQELKEQNLPLTPVAYFGATFSSLDRLAAEAEPPAHVLDALLTIFSMLLPRVSVAILRKKADYLSDLMLRVLRSKSATPSAVAAGMKCVSHLLVIRDKATWTEVSSLYGVLLSYLTDSHPKVRKQSCKCLRDVLLSFQRTAVLPPASEAITNMFERLLLLAGGSTTGASEGPRGAQEVLYVLDALKDCLPLMPFKFSTSVLKHLKSLLELKQPLVTRRITAILNVLCLHPTSDVSLEVLLDLLCLLALSVSANEMTADDMTFTARLLDVGVRKIHSLNRQICVIKLPLVFNALRDILASEHEEALFAATEAFKSLLNGCIDESLIKQGMDQIMANENVDVRKSGLTIIEKMCATIESLLDYRHAAVWDLSFQVISTMFDKLGAYSFYLLKGTLKSLSDMQKLPDEDFPYRKQLHECIGSAVGAMGPERFLSIVPLKLEAEDLSEANVWLFPILKQCVIGARLGFFKESILTMVEIVKQKSRKLEQEGMIYSARSVDGLVYSLWSLLPSFCNYPEDTDKSFKELEKLLCKVLREEPDIQGIICFSLQILINQNKKIVEGANDPSDIEASIPKKQAMANYTPQVATNNLKVLRSSARELLRVLSEIFMKSSKDAGGYFQSTISEIASISEKDVVKNFFTRTMRKLLRVTEEANKSEKLKDSNEMQIDNFSNENSLLLARAQLLDLAVALLPGLDTEEIDVLFIPIRAALKDTEGLIQKKAYKALSIILRNSNGFLSGKLEELLNLMIEVLPSCHFCAKRYRLDCLYFLVAYISKDESVQRQQNVISSFLTEIILALKEANKKTRNRAYDLLVQIGHACGDEEQGGKKEYLLNFFNMVAGGLAGETPHMISAAVKGLARLAYEFSDLVSAAYNVLPSAFLLLQRKNREIIKANLGLLKVLVAKSQADGLQMHLRSMVEGLLEWQDSTKNHFKAKVKLLLEMLVKKCGMDAVKAVTPEEHVKLLTNIRKIKERKEKKHDAKSEETRTQQSKATTSRLSRWNHTKIFSEFYDDETDSETEYMNGKAVSSRQNKASGELTSQAASLLSIRTRKAKSLPEDLLDQLEDEPLDLLDRLKTRTALQSSERLKRKADSEDELEIDSDGRIIIHEEGNKAREREVTSDPDSDTRSQEGSHLSMNPSRQAQKRRKTSESGWAYKGSEYGSKKAGGDLKKKGKLEPYAYWPLDRKMMSRRSEHRAAARKGMASVVKMTKNFEGKSVSRALSQKSSKFKKVKKGSQKKRR